MKFRVGDRVEIIGHTHILRGQYGVVQSSLVPCSCGCGEQVFVIDTEIPIWASCCTATPKELRPIYDGNTPCEWDAEIFDPRVSNLETVRAALRGEKE